MPHRGDLFHPPLRQYLMTDATTTPAVGTVN